MRNNNIDILKAICAILVVLIHVKTPIQEYYIPLTRCAVPCFFMISGYLLMGENFRYRIQNTVKKIFKIAVLSSILFACVKLVLAKGNFSSILPSYRQIIKLIFLNQNPWGNHLWYLNAYIYTLFVVWLIDKYKLWKIAFVMVPFLLLGDLALGKYSILLWGREFDYLYVRNFLFVGIPYFMIGSYIKCHKNNIHLCLNILWGGYCFLR